MKTPSQQRQKRDWKPVDRLSFFLQSCASCIRENSKIVQGTSAGRTRNEDIWGWPWQELPCEAVLVRFNEFPPTTYSSWSPEQHIRTVTNRTEQFKSMLHSFMRTFLTLRMNSSVLIKKIIRSKQGGWNSSLPAQLRNNNIITHSEDCCMATGLLLKLWRCENQGAEVSETCSHDCLMFKEPPSFHIE